MSLADLGQMVAKAAPLLGGVLGGPAGAAVGALIASKFGGDPNDPEELITRIQADPQAEQKLLQIQASNELELKRMLVTMAENKLKYDYLEKSAELKDKDSARQREVEVIQKTGKTDKTASFLAYLLTLGTFSALCYLFLRPIPVQNKELVIGIVSALTTVWISAMGYYHGSSVGSKNKDMMLMQQNSYDDQQATPPDEISTHRKQVKV